MYFNLVSPARFPERGKELRLLVPRPGQLGLVVRNAFKYLDGLLKVYSIHRRLVKRHQDYRGGNTSIKAMRHENMDVAYFANWACPS